MALMMILLGAMHAGGPLNRPASVAWPTLNLDKTGTTAGEGHDGLSQLEATYQLANVCSSQADSPGFTRGASGPRRVVGWISGGLDRSAPHRRILHDLAFRRRTRHKWRAM